MFTRLLLLAASAHAWRVAPPAMSTAATTAWSRRHWCGRIAGATAAAVGLPRPSLADSYQSGITFEGGAGGLSKSRPDTGVKVR